MRKLGVHTSIAGGLHLALQRGAALGCGTVQIFSHNPRSWSVSGIGRREAGLFRAAAGRYRISPVFVHASYLINLASDSEEVRRKSEALLAEEMRRADAIGADFVVLHAGGSPGGLGPERAAESITRALKGMELRAGLVLEQTASSLEGLRQTLRGARPLVAGVCIDSCHAFASGYDVRTREGVDSLLEGLDGAAVRLIHLNDSRGGLGSRLDRHEHIGMGRIGEEGLRSFLLHRALRGIPVILETPKKSEADDAANLERVRRMLGERGGSQVHK
ncbi:MAG: deoxyribonuclease IV [Thermodesulfovibrionales bacterium]